MEIIACCCNIVYGEGQSRVCTWLFRWWFTYILSSWVIEWLSHFLFMKKVPIYGLQLRQAIICDGRILLWTGIISWSPLALAFNTLQLFSNYFECMHRRFRGHACATTCQLRPFPKDLFALQSAYIPLLWVSGKDYINCQRGYIANANQISKNLGGKYSTVKDTREVSAGMYEFDNTVYGKQAISLHELCSSLHHRIQSYMQAPLSDTIALKLYSDYRIGKTIK